MEFHPLMLLLGLLLCALLIPYSKRRSLPYSALFHHESKTWRVRLALLPALLQICALLLMVFALADPKLPFKSSVSRTEESPEEELDLPTEGAALYLVLDRSGSMAQEVVTIEGGARKRLRRIEALKEVTGDFLKERTQDMIGLVAFARTAEVLAPLTLDHEQIQERLESLDVVKSPLQDGTAIGYALYKTASMIAATRHFAESVGASYEIKNCAIVLVTDGLQQPNPLDSDHEWRSLGVERAADYLVKEGIKLYLINIEPAIRYPQYSEHRLSLKRAAESTGGQFYIADDRAALRSIYEEIDRLEPSRLPQRVIASAHHDELHLEWRPLYFDLLLIAVLLMGSSLALGSTIFRRVP